MISPEDARAISIAYEYLPEGYVILPEEVCPSCKDRCGGTDYLAYCYCCESFITHAPRNWQHK